MSDKLATIDKAGGLAKQSQSFQQMVAREAGGAIAGFTEQNQFRIRIPRLGKIHLGLKRDPAVKTGKAFWPTDYFVLPEKLLKDKGFRETLTAMGEDPDKPKSIPIWLPSPNFWENVSTRYNAYGSSHGLLCWSDDGVTAHQSNGDGTYAEVECKNVNCPKFKSKACAFTHRLRVFLPDAEGIGIWQIDFKGKNSWGAIESEMGTIKATAHGQLAGLDLKLTLEPEQKLATMENNQTHKIEQRLTTIYVMHLNTRIKPRDMQDAIKEAAGRVSWDISEVEAFDVEYDEVTDAAPDEAEAEPTQEVINPETGECTEAPAEDEESVDPEPEEADLTADIHAELLDKVQAIQEVITPAKFKAICGHFKIDAIEEASVDQLQAWLDFYDKTAQN